MVSMVTRKFHLVAAKKEIFWYNCNNGYIDIYDKDLPPHTRAYNMENSFVIGSWNKYLATSWCRRLYKMSQGQKIYCLVMKNRQIQKKANFRSNTFWFKSANMEVKVYLETVSTNMKIGRTLIMMLTTGMLELVTYL